MRIHYQDSLTVVTPVLRDRVDDLRAMLRHIDQEVRAGNVTGDARVTFGDCRTLHFARWVLLEESYYADREPIAPSLVFSTSFDLPRDEHLHDLVAAIRSGLDQVYAHCEGYPAAGSAKEVSEYLERHDLGYNALYVGAHGRSARQIVADAKLYDEIESFVDSLGDPTGEEIRTEVCQFVAKREDLRWALRPARNLSLLSRIRFWQSPVRVAIGILAIAALGFWLPLRLLVALLTMFAIFVGFVLVQLRLSELENQDLVERLEREGGGLAGDAWKPIASLDLLEQGEDLGSRVQNPMTTIVDIIPGSFRSRLIRFVFWIISLQTRYVETGGSLVGISTIHFASWTIVDGGRRLLFFSNYDGSWESYLDEFVDRAARGLTAIWSHTMGFPPTRFLVFAGAADRLRFKAAVRAHQIPTNVWYSAYPDLTIKDVLRNSRIADGLGRPARGDALVRWLAEL